MRNFYSFFAGLVLSSTNPNLDNCLNNIKTINAIIIKSIIFAIKSPHIKVEFPIVVSIAFRSPAGKNNPINGVIISSTKAVTNFEEACPIMNAIAKPITPKLFQKVYEFANRRSFFFIIITHNMVFKFHFFYNHC